MKSKLAVLTFAAVAVVVLQSAVYAQSTYTFWASEDAWVNEANPTVNYGNSTYISVKDRSGLAEGYIRFSQQSLDSLAGQKIGSASLFLYQYQGTNSPGDILSLHRLNSDWSESVVSWNNRPGYDLTTVGFLNITGETNTLGWREWTGLKDTVSGWPGSSNFGLALENNRDSQNDELFARFYSSEYSNPALRPFLRVTTTPEPISAALFLLGGGILSFIPKLRGGMKK
ncbi:MAG: DNRLRE domain-containing protein [bacterium]